MRCRIRRNITIKSECNDAIGRGSLVTTYIAYLLCQHRVQGQIQLWMSLPRNRKPFFVVPLTCLLLIRASRHMDSKGLPVPWGRAQFVGILELGVSIIVVVVVVIVCYYFVARKLSDDDASYCYCC